MCRSMYESVLVSYRLRSLVIDALMTPSLFRLVLWRLLAAFGITEYQMFMVIRMWRWILMGRNEVSPSQTGPWGCLWPVYYIRTMLYTVPLSFILVSLWDSRGEGWKEKELGLQCCKWWKIVQMCRSHLISRTLHVRGSNLIHRWWQRLVYWVSMIYMHTIYIQLSFLSSVWKYIFPLYICWQ